MAPSRAVCRLHSGAPNRPPVEPETRRYRPARVPVAFNNATAVKTPGRFGGRVAGGGRRRNPGADYDRRSAFPSRNPTAIPAKKARRASRRRRAFASSGKYDSTASATSRPSSSLATSACRWASILARAFARSVEFVGVIDCSVSVDSIVRGPHHGTIVIRRLRARTGVPCRDGPVRRRPERGVEGALADPERGSPTDPDSGRTASHGNAPSARRGRPEGNRRFPATDPHRRGSRIPFPRPRRRFSPLLNSEAIGRNLEESIILTTPLRGSSPG